MDKFLITDRFDPFALGDAHAWRFRALTQAQAVEAITSQYARPQDANAIHSFLTPAGFSLLEHLHAFPFGLKPQKPARLNLNKYDAVLIVGYMHAPESEGGGLSGLRFVLMERGARAAVEISDQVADLIVQRAIAIYPDQVAPREDFVETGGKYLAESHRVHLEGAREDIDEIDAGALARAIRIAINARPDEVNNGRK